MGFLANLPFDYDSAKSQFLSSLEISSITLANGSRSYLLESGTIFPTPSIHMSFILSLPNFFFNLMSVSKLTRELNRCVSFFLDFCLLKDLTIKKIIGRERESGGLYILDPTISRHVACSGVTTPFETHCWLGHPSFPLLKKLCHQFSSL